MDPRVFLPCFHGPRKKNSVHNLPYGLRTRLINESGFGYFIVATSLFRVALLNSSGDSILLMCGSYKGHTVYSTSKARKFKYSKRENWRAWNNNKDNRQFKKKVI